MSRTRVPAVHGVYRTGESFLPEVRRLVRDHGHGLIELVEADLSDYEWPGEPIQLLLIDAMKSPLLMQRIAATFFPCLRPGGFLLHQDFKHHHTSWIHILHYRLRRHFQPLESVAGGATVGFVATDPIDAAEVAVASRVDCVSDAEVEASFAYSLSLLPPDEHVQVAAAHLAHYCRAGKTRQAAALAARYSVAGLDVVTGFPLAERTLGRPAPAKRVS